MYLPDNDQLQRNYYSKFYQNITKIYGIKQLNLLSKPVIFVVNKLTCILIIYVNCYTCGQWYPCRVRMYRLQISTNRSHSIPTGGTVLWNTSPAEDYPVYIVSSRPVAKSGIGGRGALPAKVDFFVCFLGESGLFCVHFGKKWTFLCAFFEKVDFHVFTPCSL